MIRIKRGWKLPKMSFFWVGLLLPWMVSAQNSGEFWLENFQKAPAAQVLESALPWDSQKGEQAAVLFHQGVFDYQQDGSLKSVTRIVYKVMNPEGVKNWSSIQVSYSPWHEDKPQIRVRITNPDGVQSEIKTADLIEVSGQSDSKNIYSYSKILKGPFPQVKEGSVIEQEIISLSRPLLPGAGLMRYWSFSGNLPEAYNTLKINLPDSQTLNFVTHELGDLKPQITSSLGVKSYVFTKSNILPFNLTETNLPTEDLKWPGVVFTTAKDWKTLSELYSKSVESQLSNQSLSIPPGLLDEKTTPWEKARKYLHWIDGKVRYTGLELGINSIVPVPPQTVLDRGYGDCKDKALLLVTLLRRSGVDAYLALLKTGPGQDVDPGVPGMDHFNHAIVYVDVAEPFFVDPTVEYNREGRLPYWDQNRWALVAKPGMMAPVRTPTALSKENLAQISRIIHLADEGSGEVEERTTYFGDYEIFYRNRWAGETPEKQKKRLAEYGTSVLRGVTSESKVTPSEDLTEAFVSHVKVKESSLALTDQTTATWDLNWGEIKSWIPEVFFNDTTSLRNKSFQLALPFRAEWVHIIHPPKGFELRGQPSAFNQTWGPFTLNSQVKALPEGALSLSLQLDTGKALETPQEFEQARSGMGEFFKNPPPVKVIFEHRAELLFKAGNYKEGFDAFKSLITEEPQKAIHHIRLSTALLNLGLGDQAHLSAQKAVELEPTNDKAWSNLGWTLEFNSLGRRFGKGWDRENSVAAFKKALELKPDGWYHRANLAILLEVDPNGFRFGRDEDLLAARKEYESLGNFLENGELRGNFLNVLFLLGDYKALEQGAVSGTRDLKNLYLFLAKTAVANVAEGIKVLEPQLSAADRSRILTQAGEKLIQVRFYEKAAAVFREAAKGSSDSVSLEYKADGLAGSKVAEFKNTGLTTPESVVRSYIIGRVRGNGTDFSPLKPLMTESFYAWGLGKGTPFYSQWSSFARISLNQGVLPATLTDLILSKAELEVRGDEKTGVHVGLRSEGNEKGEGYFVVNEQGKWLLAATGTNPGIIGREILKFSASQDWNTAGLWLDWFYEDQVEQSSAGILVVPLKAFWRTGDSRDQERIVLAARALKGIEPENEDELKELETALTQVVPGSDLETGLRQILSSGYAHLGNFKKSASLLQPLMEKNPREESLLSRYFEALRRSGQREKAQVEITFLMNRYPRDMNVIRQGIYLYVTELNFPGLDDLLKKYTPRLEAMDYNNLAWMELFKGSVSEGALEWGRKAVNLTGSRSRAAIHTLATLYAEMGRYEEARKLLDQGMALGHDLDPLGEDWYVLGRVAEGYGFIESAISAYERVQPLEDASDLADTFRLAKNRLEFLKK